MGSTSLDAARSRPNTDEMIVVHDAFRREFGLLRGLVREVRGGDLDRAEVLAAHYRDLATFLHHHHTGEDDLLWPRLLERAAPDAALVRRMEEQHERVAALMAAADELVGRWEVAAASPLRDALADVLDALVAALEEHLAEEERAILPLVEAHLSVAEWEELGERARASTPKHKLVLMLGAILEDLSPASRLRFLATMPLPARLMWRAAGERHYRRYARQVRGAPA